MRALLGGLFGLGLSALALAMGIPQIQYQTNDDFIRQAFGDQQPQWKMLMLDADLKQQAADILHHPYSGTRVRYWINGRRTAWILDVIGKEMPITIGVVIDGTQVQQVKVLVYREERGGEVHEDFFARQFQGAELTPEVGLSKAIDGITGATMSVDAVTRVTTLVLVLHRLALERPLDRIAAP